MDPPSAGPAPPRYVVQVEGTVSEAIPAGGRELDGDVGPGTYVLSIAAADACGTSPPTPTQTITVP